MFLVRFLVRPNSERISMKIRSLSANRKRLASALFSSVLGFGVVLGTALPVPAADAMSNRMVTYKGEGRTLFALSLLPTKPLPVLQTSRVAIVVDTSASQNGDFRTDSIEVAQSIVEALPESSVVCLLACDVEPVVLSQASSPTSKSIAEGFKKLEKRVPLGTTDLAGALRAARRELGAHRARKRVVGHENWNKRGQVVHAARPLVNGFLFSPLFHGLMLGWNTDGRVHNRGLTGNKEAYCLMTLW